MKKKFLDSKEAFDLGLVLLAKTTPLDNDLIATPPWNYVKELYESLDEKESPVFGYVVSIINSICTHKRAYISLTRSGVAKIVREDLNHNPPSGFSNSLYPALRAFLQDQKYIKLFVAGNKRLKKADSFEVIDPELLEFMNLKNLAKQMAEAKSFSDTADRTTDIDNRQEILDEKKEGNSTQDEVIIRQQEIHKNKDTTPKKIGPWGLARSRRNEGF